MGRPHLLLTSTPLATRLRLRVEGETLLRASLPPPSMHPRQLRAAPALCEALAIWLEQPLCVALDAGEPDGLSGLGLCDDFGFGARTLYYEVEVVAPHRRRASARARRAIEADGDDRQLELGGVK